MEIPTTLAALFIFLGTPLFMGAVSDFLATQPWFQTLDSYIKNYILIALAVGLALASRALQLFIPGTTLETLDPWYNVVATALTYVFGQLWHKKMHVESASKG